MLLLFKPVLCKKIRIFTFFLICFSFFSSFGQIITFADQNFKNLLLSANGTNFIAQSQAGNSIIIDQNGNNEIEISEAQNVYYLSVSNGSINNLDGLNNFSNLIDFSCIDNEITNLDISALTNLKNLNCDYNSITNINFGENSVLESLYCNNNQISVLNLNNLSNLTYLECKNNFITNLSLNQCQNLLYFYCENNLLTDLNASNMASLEYFDCSHNNLQNIVLINSNNLTGFNCNYNELTNINLNNLSNLIELRCNYNNLETLSIPDSTIFQYLYCENNQLTNLSIGNCPNFYTLFCSNNHLTSINLSNFMGLNWFVGNNNLLTSINISGLNDLAVFECKNNQLTQFDLTLNNSSNVIFYLDNNQLTNVLFKNGMFNNVSLTNNPDLAYICCDYFETAYYQEFINYSGLTNCFVTSNCGPDFFEPSIQGVFTYDNTLNGCDTNDPIITDVQLKVNRASIISPFFTYNSAPLSTTFFNSAYTLTPLFENPNYFTVTPPSVTLDLYQATPSNIIQNFCVAPNGTHHDLEVVLLPISDAIPGMDVNYKIVYKNNGTHSQSGNINLTFQDNIFDIVIANPNFNNQILNELNWNFTNLQPFETREILVVLNLNSSSATNGSALDFIITATSSTNDENPSDNTFALSQTAIENPTSNSKLCLEGASITTSLVGEYVHYLIRFQNNINAIVQNITINDFIDSNKFDISSIIPISSSHLYKASIPEFGLNNTLVINYKNINLSNDGYFAFKIKTNSNLFAGDSFSNTAKIYYNTNPPVNTNTTLTVIGTLGITENENNSSILFYPNPSNNKITFNQTVKSALIYSIEGKLIPVKLENNQIDVSHLLKGIYLVQFTDENDKSVTQKLIKN
jgi:uncharacterized repeat protein (TIGR01451 family)